MGVSSKPSVKRISEETGFSPATVSNALNMKRGVNKETADIIFQAAEKLGYSMNKGIKHIKFVLFRRTGAIIDDSQFHPAVIEGVEDEAKENGLSTQFIRLNYDALDFTEEVKRIVSDPNGAIILLGTELMDEDFQLFAQCKSPIILLDGWCDQYSFNGVLIDNLDSASAAVSYLVRKGHREIGYICGNYRIKAFQARESGYLQAMHRHSLPVNPAWRVVVGTKAESAYTDMMQWLDTKPELPTAFFVDNDLIAISVLRALKDHGLRVPEDVSLVGFDDLPICKVITPALTTINVHRKAMGREAVRQLLSMMDSEDNSKFKIESCTEFVERDSVCDRTEANAQM